MKQGFTLLEVVVAVSIFLLATLAIARLMASTENISGIARGQFIALNIAREGLELVRDYRDNNWFTQDPDVVWTTGICPDDDNAAYSFTIDSNMVRNNTGVGDADKDNLYIQTNQEWTHHKITDAVKTAYSRVITIDCSKQKLANDESIIVTSKVTWQDHQKERTIELREKLTNWLQFKPT